MMAENVVVETVENGLLIVTINRPDVRNAVNASVARSIGRALDRLDSDRSLRAGIITGAGGHFCSGTDLGAWAKGDSPYATDGRGYAGIAERSAAKPIIAAVEGYALGGGFEIALACDLIVAARSAVFGLPEARWSMVAMGGGLLRLPRRIPYHQAMELALTGVQVGAPRMGELGLVNRVVEDGAALETAVTLGQAIARNGPLALEAAKRIIAESGDWSSETAFAQQALICGPLLASDDVREGAVAFTEKRSAVWRGR